MALSIISLLTLQPSSPLSTLLYRGDLWHALTPSFPCPGLYRFLFPFTILIIVGPIHLLLQVPPGASQGVALWEMPCTELGAESDKGEALAALLLLERHVLSGNLIISIYLIHAVAQH